MSVSCMLLQGKKENCTVATPAFVIGTVLATSGKNLTVTINKEIKEAVILLKDYTKKWGPCLLVGNCSPNDWLLLYLHV